MTISRGLAKAAALALILPCFSVLAAEGAGTAGSGAKGIASWYGADFHGRKTASGEIFDRFKFTAAHRSLPFGTLLLVTLESSGRRVVVRVNDRGPFVEGRIIDLSEAAAVAIGLDAQGLGRVSLEMVKDFPVGPLSGTAAQAGQAAVVGAVRPSEAPSPSPAAQAWCDIQVASFSRKGNADNAVLKLAAAGYSPEIRGVSGFFRVILAGLPAERAEAERKRLEVLGFPGVLVTLHQIAKDR
jgi:rare lipoprotein A